MRRHANTTPHKTLRKAHKKSRLGCQECKRRHIKCDESRPTCTNCLSTPQASACIYQSPLPRTVQSSPQSASTPRSTGTSVADTASATPTSSPASTQTGPTLPLPTTSTLTASAPSPSPVATSPAQYCALNPPLNLRHIELFSHFIFETVPSLDDRSPFGRGQAHTVMSTVLNAPYAVHQILALSALHMSYTQTDQAEYYRLESMAHQTQAICLFSDSHIEVTAENCAPKLFFSSFLGLQALAEATMAAESDTAGFLDRFVTYLNLHRGVRAVTARSWELLRQSGLSPILARAERALDALSSQKHEQAAMVGDHLHALLDRADMSTQSEMACRDAVSQLRRVYGSEPWPGEVPGEEHYPGLIWTWPVSLSGDFTDLLLKRRPEALIILCYYAVLLHRRRSIWLVGDAGRMLVEEITKFLGQFWKEWLMWANEMLG